MDIQQFKLKIDKLNMQDGDILSIAYLGDDHIEYRQIKTNIEQYMCDNNKTVTSKKFYILFYHNDMMQIDKMNDKKLATIGLQRITNNNVGERQWLV